MLTAYWDKLAHTPLGCSVDQGILAWLYATNEANIILDYDMTFLSNKLKENFEFNEVKGMYSIVKSNDTIKYYPALIHHSGDKSKYYEYAEKVITFRKKYLFTETLFYLAEYFT